MSALRHRTFRVVFVGAFLSNIGTWMQSAVLAGYGYSLTRSASFVGLLWFAQLGPSVVLSIVGGLVADLVDRRKLLIWLTLEQLSFAIALAVITRADDPSRVAIVLVVLGMGIGQALYAPAYSAVLPALVGSDDLPGAISLNSAQMNGSRVIGPVVGGLLLHAYGPSWVFAGNAATYLFVVAALLAVRFPPRTVVARRDLRELLVGFQVARADRVVRRALVTVVLFSAFALTFVGQLATVT
jgi:MFS family permease